MLSTSCRPIAIVTLAIVLASCSTDELTRDRAKELILAEAPAQNDILYTTSTWTIDLWQKEGRESMAFVNEQTVKLFRIAGLIQNLEFNKKGFASGTRWKSAFYEVTDKTAPYLRPANVIPDKSYTVSVVTYTGDITEITGIAYTTEAKNLAKVEYEVKYTATPMILFEEVNCNLKGWDFESKEGLIEKKTISMQKYDDGWRVQQQ